MSEERVVTYVHATIHSDTRDALVKVEKLADIQRIFRAHGHTLTPNAAVTVWKALVLGNQPRNHAYYIVHKPIGCYDEGIPF